jgi:hypothetical protein
MRKADRLAELRQELEESEKECYTLEKEAEVGVGMVWVCDREGVRERERVSERRRARKSATPWKKRLRG